MTKQSTITSLIVVPLIASAVFLASPAYAANSTQKSQSEIRHKTSLPHVRKGIAGTVSSISGTIIIVTTKNDVKYTVDAGSATIMKASDESNANPFIVTINDIKIGDAIMVRGEINDSEISAEKIFDGKPAKDGKHGKFLKHLRHAKK